MKNLRSILRRDPIRTRLSIVILSSIAVCGVACDDEAPPTNDRVETELGGRSAGAEVTEAGRDAGGSAGESAMIEGGSDVAGEGAGAEDDLGAVRGPVGCAVRFIRDIDESLRFSRGQIDQINRRVARAAVGER